MNVRELRHGIPEKAFPEEILVSCRMDNVQQCHFGGVEHG
jgi:hypothetical protein